jgi:copper chaperone CopZ
VEGVIASSTNYAKQEAEVEFDEKKATIAQILEQVKKTGYTAEVK